MGFATTLTVLALSIPTLDYVGIRAVLSSRDGRVVDPVLDPTEEGFEATVRATPVALVVQVDAAGALTGLTTLALSADGGGGVLFLPVDTLTDNTLAFGFDRLAGAFELAGLDGVRQAVANTVGTSFTDAIEVDPQRLAELLAPVSPLMVQNSDDLVAVDSDGVAVTVFPAGPLILEASDAADYLAHVNPGESDLARLARHQAFWEVWLAAITASGDVETAVPGEGGSGLTRYLRDLAGGSVAFETLPVEPATAPSDGRAAFAPLPQEIGAVVDRLVPLPTAANPGDRVRVRVLDGTGTDAAVSTAIERLVPAGAEIVVIGNADRFDYDRTEVRYSDRSTEDVARTLRHALGVGDVALEVAPNDTFDVTVVVGQDFLELAGAADASRNGTETEDGTTG